jgi:hypothetical protein
MNSETLTNYIRRKELISEINVKRQEFVRLNKQIELIENEKINLLAQIQTLVENHSKLSDLLLEQEYNALVSAGQ